MAHAIHLYLSNALLFTLFTFSNHAAQAVDLNRPNVSVVGVGQIQGVANLADLSLEFSVDGPDSSAAMDEVNRRLNKLLSQLEKHGVSNADVVAGSVRIYPRYDYRNDQEIFLGYSVDRAVHVTVRNLENLPVVLQTAVAAELSQIKGVSYRSHDQQTLMKRARDAAIANSKLQANALAEGYNAQLGAVYSIHYKSSDADIGRSMSFEVAQAAAVSSDRAPGRYLPGKITVTEKVEVVFELLPES